MTGSIAASGDVTSLINNEGGVLDLVPYGVKFRNMFDGCTSLSSVPVLPSVTLTPGCYIQMFKGCTSLVQAPSLPSTTLTQGCYIGMFYGCTSLTAAPTLLAPILTQGCYSEMFQGCTLLHEVHCSAHTNEGVSYATDDWLIGVAATGDIYLPEGYVWTTGGSGIPSGWTVHTV